MKLTSVCLFLAIIVGVALSQCTEDLPLNIQHEVLNAASDNCAQFRLNFPRAFYLPGFTGVSESLVLDETQPHTFLVNSLGTGFMEMTLLDSTNPNIAFYANLTFSGFHRCALSEEKWELTPACTSQLPLTCYQCFNNWDGTLTGLNDAAGIVISLTGRAEHPFVQVGRGANNKNVNYGISGWCDWTYENCPVGANCTGICDINADITITPPPPSVSGDPHFIGFRGQRYDFHGVADGVFNIITDTNFHMNARFVNADLRPKKVHKTYLGDIGVLIGSHKVQVSCNRGGEHIILLDDKPLERGVARTLPDENNALILRDNSDKILIDSHPYTIRLWFSSSRHSSCHLTMKAAYASGSADYPHGVLGQTADPKKVGLIGTTKPMQGEGIIDGVWTDYRIEGDDLFGTAFKYNKFDPSQSDGQLVDEDEFGSILSAASF